METKNKLDQYSIYLILFGIAFILWNVIQAAIIIQKYG